MKISLATFFFLAKQSAHAFVVINKDHASSLLTTSNNYPLLLLQATEKDDDDDWFADFDDFDFNTNNNGNGGDGRRQQQQQFSQPNFSTSQKSYRRNDAPYERDTSRDNSNIDEGMVFKMLSERRQAQQRREYDRADAIREILMTDYHVGVNDRERTWRTGCSNSGSGRKFGGGGNNRRQSRSPSRRPPQDLGPNGHDYDFTGNGNNSQLSEKEVHTMLAERLQAKFNRNFEIADSIQRELIDSGVYVHDGLKQWRADGEPFDQGSGGGRDGTNNNSFDRRDRGGRGRNMMGPHDHDYYLSSNAGDNSSSLSEDEIHSLLAERLQSKKQHDFRKADAIQQELIDAGVFVHDQRKEWRADGIPFENFRNDDDNRRRNTNSRDYAQSPHSEAIPEGMTERMVTKLLQERAKYKTLREYQKADKIRDGLKDRYQIYIDDRTQEWSVGGNFGDDRNTQREISQSFANRDYTQSPSSLDLPDPDAEEAVVAMLKERSEAKQRRDYETADAIREELLGRYDVVIQDKMKQWSVGGTFTDEVPRSRGKREYFLRGSAGDLSEDDITVIKALLAERQEAKKNRDFDTADTLRDQLNHDYNIIMDDKNLEWKVDNDEYVLIDGEHNSRLSEEDIAMVHAKISERFVLKQQRSYNEADAIRDDLMERFGIQINDRTKEWRVNEEEETPSPPVVDNYDGGDDDDFSYTVDPDEEHYDDEEEPTMVSNDDDDDDSIEAKVDDIYSKLDDTVDSFLEDFDEKDEATATTTSSSSSSSSVDAKLDQALDDFLLEDDDNDDDDDDGSSINSSSSLTEEELSSLTVPLLKEKLKEAGLRVSGKKAELVARLLA